MPKLSRISSDSEGSSLTVADHSNIYADHSRNWKENRYVYPVISRRSRGLSIGVNLNPDKACNFDCVYCQVDRAVPGKFRSVDLSVLRVELEHMIRMAMDQTLFSEPQFSATPPELRRLNDIAFSGDGEPTTCPQFLEAVQLSAELKAEHRLADTRIVLITDACYLTKPQVSQALEIMDANQGEVWAKLDAGTEEYYQSINRPNFPLGHVLENILAAAKVRPVVIQSLFMRVHQAPPPTAEIDAFCQRLNDIRSQGGQISAVQIYTIARNPAENYVTPLSDEEVDAICELVRARTQLHVDAYYGVV